MARKPSKRRSISSRAQNEHGATPVAPPTKNTSGAGFPFETEVVAACLLDLVLEQPLEGTPSSRLESVSVQQSPAHWKCDDIQLIYVKNDGEQILVPTSVKSYPILSSATKLSEFVKQAWNDVLSTQTRPRHFRLAQDRIGLFTAPHDPKVAHFISELIKKAREQNTDFRQRVTVAGHLGQADKWLRRFACPKDIEPEGGTSDGERQAFIGSLELRQFDFESPTSQSRRLLVNLCRSATISESHEDGRLVWQELCQIAEQLRHAGGDIMRPGLIRKLGCAPQLKEAPRFADSFRRLAEQCERDLKGRSYTIGRSIRLERPATLDRLIKSARKVDALAILGTSGIGKTTSAALLSRALSGQGRILWLELPLALKLAEARGTNILNHGDSLTDLIANVSSAAAWLVIDGLDRATRVEDFRTIADLINTAMTAENPWRIIATCQQEHWTRVRRLLIESGLPGGVWTVDVVEPLSADEVQQVAATVPAILPVISQPRLFDFIRRPLILDILVRSAEEAEIPDREWVGESHLVEWFWETRVCGRTGIIGSEILIELGRRQADTEELETALARIGPSLSAVELLLEAGVLRHQNGRVAFAHDTIADWARFRWLLAQDPGLSDAIDERSHNPLWHSAFQLLSVHLLEQYPDTSKWQLLIDGCESAIDFALDGVLFSADSQNLLARVADRLFVNDAALAKSLIRRAIVVCTTPNSWLLKRAAANQSNSPFLRTIARDPRPYQFFWGPLLQFLQREKARLTDTLAKDAADAATVWLEMTPPKWPYRREAADIALTLAERLLKDRSTYRYASADEDATAIYGASLWAFSEDPSRAQDLFLDACSLVPPSRFGAKTARRVRRQSELSSADHTVDKSSAEFLRWPGGPYGEADEAFRDACFSQSGMECLYERDPALARQMLFALMVDIRRSNDADDCLAAFDLNQCGLIPPSPGLSAPHYLQGPFLRFLRWAPVDGIRLVIDIVNFSSARAGAIIRKRRPFDLHSLSSPLGTGDLWVGNESTMSWNRAHIDACPRAVAPLTALEKLLSDRAVSGESIDDEIALILASNRSVAMAGLLLDLGRRYPPLFDGPLRVLLLNPILLIWSEVQNCSPQPPRLGGPDTQLGECFFEEHKSWLFAEFRNRCILEDVERLLPLEKIRWAELDSTPFRAINETPVGQRLQMIRNIASQRPPAWVVHANEEMGRVLGQRPGEPVTPTRAATPLEDALADATSFHAAILDGRYIEEKALESLREELPDLDVARAATSAEMSLVSRHARLGLAIFLLIRHEAWLKKVDLFDEYLAHAIRETSDIEFAHRSNNIDAVMWLDWQSAIAPMAVRLWADQADDSRLLRWVAHLAVFGSGAAKRALLTETFTLEARLGQWQPRLLQLVLRSAAAWWEVQQNLLQSEAPFDIMAWWDGEFIALANRHRAPEIPILSDLYLRDPPLRYAHWRLDSALGRERDLYFRLTPLNTHNVIAAVVHATPLLATAESACQCVERLKIVRLALDAELAHLVAYDAAAIELSIPCNEYPMPGQQEVLDRIVAELNASQDPSTLDSLWQPVIGLGVMAPRWIEYFISKWLWPNLALPTCPANFEATWTAMIRFAKDHPNWRSSTTPEEWDARPVWASIIGVGKYGFELWRVEHTGIIDRAAPLLESIVGELTAWPETAAPVLRWITRGPGRRFTIRAIRSITSTIETFTLDDRCDGLLNSSLAEFLDGAWCRERDSLSSNQSTRQAFQLLLRRVARTGSPLAIDLEQRVRGRV